MGLAVSSFVCNSYCRVFYGLERDKSLCLDGLDLCLALQFV